MLKRNALLAVLFCVAAAPELRAQGNPRDFERAGPAAERQMYYAQIRKEVHETLLRWRSALEADDAKKVAAFYSDDASVFPAGASVVQTRDSIRSHFAGFVSGVGSIEFQMMDFGTSGDLAYVTIKLTYVWQPQGSVPRPVTRTDMIILQRRFNSSWVIQSHLAREEPEVKPTLSPLP
jgi:ketosteroid isomerase-like protein